MVQSNSHQHNTFDTSEVQYVRLLKEKRKFLEQLIAFTKQIHVMGNSFEFVSNMSKPSQRPNKRMMFALAECISEMERYDTDELQAQLNDLDGVIQKDLHRMVVLSEMTEAEFIELFGDPTASHGAKTYQAIQTEISSFADKAYKDLAIRYLLTQRGAQIGAYHCHLPQESLNEITDTLRAKEKCNRDRIEENTQEILSDTIKALQSQHIPKELADHLLIVQRNLEFNLKQLQSGRPIDRIFSSTGVFQVDEELLAEELAKEKPEKVQKMENQESKPQEKLTQEVADNALESPATVSSLGYFFISVSQFFKDIVRWATSSWSVGWRQIRSESKKQLQLKKPR